MDYSKKMTVLAMSCLPVSNTVSPACYYSVGDLVAALLWTRRLLGRSLGKQKHTAVIYALRLERSEEKSTEFLVSYSLFKSLFTYHITYTR